MNRVLMVVRCRKSTHIESFIKQVREKAGGTELNRIEIRHLLTFLLYKGSMKLSMNDICAITIIEMM